jgi:hypothetical protein
MRVKVFGGGAGYGPDGVMTSWAPNQVVDVDDSDKDAVAFYNTWVDAGSAEVVIEPKAAPAPSSTSSASSTPAKATAKATKATKS